MGELKQRGQMWWIRYYKNGRCYEESSGSTKESDAKSLLRLSHFSIAQPVALAASGRRPTAVAVELNSP